MQKIWLCEQSRNIFNVCKAVKNFQLSHYKKKILALIQNGFLCNILSAVKVERFPN